MGIVAKVVGAVSAGAAVVAITVVNTGVAHASTVGGGAPWWAWPCWLFFWRC